MTEISQQRALLYPKMSRIMFLTPVLRRWFLNRNTCISFYCYNYLIFCGLYIWLSDVLESGYINNSFRRFGIPKHCCILTQFEAFTIWLKMLECVLQWGYFFNFVFTSMVESVATLDILLWHTYNKDDLFVVVAARVILMNYLLNGFYIHAICNTKFLLFIRRSWFWVLNMSNFRKVI